MKTPGLVLLGFSLCAYVWNFSLLPTSIISNTTCKIKYGFYRTNDYYLLFNAACAAASLAIGTRNGEQLT